MAIRVASYSNERARQRGSTATNARAVWRYNQGMLGESPLPAPTGRADGTLRVAVGVVLCVAAAARISNAFLLRPLKDYDAPGHALNAFALYEGHLPDPLSWSGFHPPLYYAVGAVIWHLLPESFPVHVALRLLSLVAGAGAVALAWSVLKRHFEPLDAAVVATVAFCTPVVLIATSMLGNETMCALFVTAALARLCALPKDPQALPRHAAVTGLLAAFAALAKATGMIAICSVLLSYTLHGWRDRKRALATLAAATAVPLLLLTPLYVQLLREAGGSPASLISGSAASPDVRAEMAEQPPGFRRLSQYFSFPAVAVLAPAYAAPGLAESVPGLFYATLQADGQAQFLPLTETTVYEAGRALALAGLLPTALALIGMVRALRSPRRFAWAAPLALFGGLIVLAFLRYVWIFPHYSAVKASYVLSALLPGMAALALGLDATKGRVRSALRLGLLAVAVLDTTLLWIGLWT
jgi:hypothetical protein